MTEDTGLMRPILERKEAGEMITRETSLIAKFIQFIIHFSHLGLFVTIWLPSVFWSVPTYQELVF
jgi:hypothetical protein